MNNIYKEIKAILQSEKEIFQCTQKSISMGEIVFLKNNLKKKLNNE